MGWSPTVVTPILEVNVNENFTQAFSYTDDTEGSTETFTITGISSAETDSGVTVGTSISGAYTGTLHGSMSLYYLKDDGTYATVDDFNKVVDGFEMCSYTAPSQQQHDNVYTVTATGDEGTVVTQSYTIRSIFNWTVGMNALKAAIDETRIGRINTPAYVESE